MSSKIEAKCLCMHVSKFLSWMNYFNHLIKYIIWDICNYVNWI